MLTRTPSHVPPKESPSQPVYEAWKLHFAGHNESTQRVSLCGLPIFTGRNEDPTAVDWANQPYAQQGLQDMVEAAATSSKRSFVSRLFHSSTYEQDLDTRARQMPVVIQDALLSLLDDRNRACSSQRHVREWKVVLLREQRRDHFTGTTPGPTRRRFWRSKQPNWNTEYFLVIRGAAIRSADNGDFFIAGRHHNPWRRADNFEANEIMDKKFPPCERSSRSPSPPPRPFLFSSEDGGLEGRDCFGPNSGVPAPLCRFGYSYPHTHSWSPDPSRYVPMGHCPWDADLATIAGAGAGAEPQCVTCPCVMASRSSQGLAQVLGSCDPFSPHPAGLSFPSPSSSSLPPSVPLTDNLTTPETISPTATGCTEDTQATTPKYLQSPESRSFVSCAPVAELVAPLKTCHIDFY